MFLLHYQSYAEHLFKLFLTLLLKNLQFINIKKRFKREIFVISYIFWQFN